MPMYDFKCTQCGNEFETIVSMDTMTSPCAGCGSEVKRSISAPMIKLDGTDPSFPGAYSQWEKKRKQKMAQERKAEE